MGRTACTEPQCLYKGALYHYLYVFLFRGHPGEVVTALWLFMLSLSLSCCNKHWEGNIDMSLEETGFEDVHLNLLAQQSTSGVLL
jgi:hypothetical protein